MSERLMALADEDQPGFHYFECHDCGFDSVQPASFSGSEYCPLCDGDNNRANRMSRRIARVTDKPEGRDARATLARDNEGTDDGR